MRMRCDLAVTCLAQAWFRGRSCYVTPAPYSAARSRAASPASSGASSTAPSRWRTPPLPSLMSPPARNSKVRVQDFALVFKMRIVCACDVNYVRGEQLCCKLLSFAMNPMTGCMLLSLPDHTRHAPRVSGRTGKYFRFGLEERSSVESYDRDLQRDVWVRSARLTHSRSLASGDGDDLSLS